MRARQRGAFIVEFAIAATALFVVLFGAIEMQRVMAVRAFLEEGVRRGARVATVCPVNSAAIKNAALMNSGGSPVVNGLTAANFQLTYLDINGVTLVDPAGSFPQIAFVRLSLENFSIDLAIPFFSFTFAPAGIASMLPAESLGVSDEVVVTC